MRCVHVTNYFQPWMGYQETYLTRAQAALGHEVHLITADRINPRVARAVKAERFVGVGRTFEEGVHVHRLRARIELGVRMVWLEGLGDKLEEIRPEAVHCHGVYNLAGLSMARLKRRLGFRLVFDEHCAAFNTDARSTFWRRAMYAFFRTFLRDELVSHADELTVVGEPEREFSVRELGLPRERIRIVRLGADCDRFRPDPEGRRRRRDAMSCREDEIVLVYAGKFGAGKDIPVLLDALRDLRHVRGLPVRLWLAGSGDAEEVESYRARIREGGLEAAVTFLPFLDHAALAEVFSAADLGVWPGDASQSYIEAMATGLPLVLARTDYTEGILPPGGGCLFPRGEAAELATSIAVLATDAEQRRAASRTVLTHVTSKMSWTAIAQEYLDLYRPAVAPDGLSR